MGSSDSKVADVQRPDEAKSGEPVAYDPKFKGPINNRGCTDIICCLLFVVCFIAMVGVGILAFVRGDPRVLLYPTDSDGNICGYGDYKDKPNLFFFDMIDCAKMGAAVAFSGCPTPQVCVASCPNDYWAWFPLYAEETAQSLLGNDDKSGRSAMVCKYNVSPMNSSKDVQQLVEDEDCAAYYVPTTSVVGRCVPAIFKTIVDKAADLVGSGSDNETFAIVDKLNNTLTGSLLEDGSKYLAILLNAKEYGVKIFQDVRAAWWMILIGIFLSMVIAFVWILLLRCLAGPIVFLTLFLFVAIFSFTTYYSWIRWVDLKDNPDSQVDGVSVEFTTNLDYYNNLEITWLVLAIISSVILFIILVIVIFLRKRLLLAIALIKETSRAIGSMMFILIWPIFPFLMEIALFAFWVTATVFLASAGEGEFAASNKTIVNVTDNVTGDVIGVEEIVEDLTSRIPCDPDDNSTVVASVCGFLKYGDPTYTVYIQLFMFFMFLWVANFIVALSEMVMAGSFASYYWAFNKPQDFPHFPIIGAVWRSFRFHLGTLAFGSLIIAIIQMIRVILEYIDRKVRDKKNKVAQFILCCLKCCFYCLEKFMKFINRNAYILTAIHSYNFCRAALKAFQLILRNVVRVVVIDKVTDFLMFISKLMVVSVVTAFAYLFFSGELEDLINWNQFSDYVSEYSPELNFYLTPVIILAILSYIVAAAFFSVYTMGVDTLFLCFLEDMERNDGTLEKPYYMSKEMMKIVGVKNKPKGGKKKGCCTIL